MLMANKKLSILLIFVLTLFILPLTNYAEAAMPELIKVGLYYGSGAKSSYTVSSPNGLAVFLANDENGVRIFSDPTLKTATVSKNTYYSTECVDVFGNYASASAKVTTLRNQGLDAYCAVSGSNFTVRIGKFSSFEEAKAYAPKVGTYAIHSTTTGVFVMKDNVVKIAIDDPTRHLEMVPLSGNITINSVEYRGVIRFLRKSGNDMAAINVLNVEHYLYSVVSKEMSPSWNAEALKAQAVAARTFTITNFNKYANYDFNLDNTTNSQAYGGVKAEDYRTTAAVNATAGEIVKYNGSPASIYYFAASGGKTANSEDVWSSALPYLRSVDDPYENPDQSPHSRWKVTYTKQQLKDLLSKKGVNIGDITDVQAEYAASGHALKITIVGTSGSKAYTKDNIRSALSLKSTNFDLIKDGGTTKVSAIDASQTQIAIELNESISVMSANGISPLKTNPTILSATGTHTPTVNTTPPGTYVFSGGGWGHGIGMSQWGAKGMADNGFTYKQILTHYYTGVQVEKY